MASILLLLILKLLFINLKYFCSLCKEDSGGLYSKVMYIPGGAGYDVVVHIPTAINQGVICRM